MGQCHVASPPRGAALRTNVLAAPDYKGHKPLQRGPERRTIVLTAIEPSIDISLTPRD
jgi:hypothetical protein